MADVGPVDGRRQFATVGLPTNAGVDFVARLFINVYENTLYVSQRYYFPYVYINTLTHFILMNMKNSLYFHQQYYLFSLSELNFYQ
jgi:hypothetical protein